MVDRHVPQCGHMDIYLALTNIAISNDLKLVFMMFYDANDHHHLYHNHYCHHIDDQEYERAVIFRLGRLLTGGARGPGHRQQRHRHQCHHLNQQQHHNDNNHHPHQGFSSSSPASTSMRRSI